MGKIVILDEITANKIAAGEVVERPSSVIKELVENSLDAGATSITVDIKNGGISYIKVSDNGSGIAEDDVELAFERHATSKIRKAEDLESIHTMGFRGEALASIASVATVELTTRTAAFEHGVFIKVSGGKLMETSQIGCPAGTTFIVRELFFNTPARYKFLKKDTSEAAYVTDVMERIALANPAVSFKLTANGSALLHSPGNNDLKSVVYSIYGREIANGVKEIKLDDGKIKITGFAGRPEISRGNRNHQTVFVNGRYIKSRIVTAAIDEAYKTMLMKGKFAFSIINIEVNSMLVDVNVHPTKMEVRFSDEQAIFRGVYQGIQGALLGGTREIASALSGNRNNQVFKVENIEKKEYQQQPILNKSSSNVNRGEYVTPFQEHRVRDAENESLPAAKADIIQVDAPRMEAIKAFETHVKRDEAILRVNISKEAQKVYELLEPLKERHKEGENSNVHHPISEDLSCVVGKSGIAKDENADIAVTNFGSDHFVFNLEENAAQVDGKELKPLISDSQIIGQAFSTYIILQRENELYLVDQHAAHERIIYERMKIALKDKKVDPQMLLMPEVIELAPHDFKIVLGNITFFYDLGFTIEDFGNNSIIVRSIPSVLTDTPFKQSFMSVLDAFTSKGEREISLIADEAIHTMACKAAIKANKRLSNDEIKELLLKMEELFNPFTCPHGRPTVLKLTKYEIEKMFKRAGAN